VLATIQPKRSGNVERSGHRISWQEFGAGRDALLLLPTWSIVHTDFWRYQVRQLSERRRVITFDGLGNGGSDRPAEPEFYGDLLFAGDALAVLDATGTERASVAGVSAGAGWALALAALHPSRVSAAIFIGASVPLAPGHPERVAAADAFMTPQDSYSGWSKWNRHYWLQDFPGFLRFFFSKCFTEPDSDTEIEHFFRMGMETTPEVLLATFGDPEQNLDARRATEFAGSLHCTSLVIHGTNDAISPMARAEELARLTRGDLHVMPGAGHEPQCRFPRETNAIIEGFLAAAHEE
jgi:pimeloyl-ACP methyl ester carboxylesterase